MSIVDTRPSIAIFGLGRAGHFHLTSLSNMSHLIRLKYVMDVNKELADRVAQRYHATPCYDVDTIISDPEIKAVVVSSVTHAHYEQISKSIRAGKAVFTEKPISFNENELESIINLAVESKIPFFVGFQRRIDENFKAMKDLVHGGKIGQVRMIRSTSRDNPSPPLSYLEISGGIFHDMVCHDVDMLHYISNEIPESVYTIAHCYDPDIAKHDDVDTVVVTLKYPSGILATIDVSRTADYCYDQRVEVFGEKGMIQAENERVHTVTVANRDGYTSAPNKWSFPQRYEKTYRLEMEYFINSLVLPWKTEAEEETRRHILLERVVTAAEWSYKRGRPVFVREVEEERKGKK